MKSKVVLGITGGTGALGRRLVELALEKGFVIRCLVRNKERAKLFGSLKIDFSYGDITDKDTLNRFVKNLDVCIHLAALVGHATKEEYTRVNEIGTDNLCVSIIEHNPKCHFIHCSSISALKAKRILTFLSSNYGKSKLAGDKRVDYHTQHNNLKSTVIYPGLIYGPYDNHFVPVLLEYLKKRKVFFVSGGEKNGPVIYIDDLCELFLVAASNNDSIGNKYLGVGSLEMGIHDFIRILAEKTNFPLTGRVKSRSLLMMIAAFSEFLYTILCIHTPPPLSKRIVGFFSINFMIDLDKFCWNLNWSPKMRVPDGIDNALDWRNKHNVAKMKILPIKASS